AGPACDSLPRPRTRVFDTRLEHRRSNSPKRGRRRRIHGPARGALRNRLLRILRERARAHESGSRERGAHANGWQLIIERINIMHRFFFAAGLAASTFVVAACGGSYGTSSPSGPSDTPPPAGAIRSTSQLSTCSKASS